MGSLRSDSSLRRLLFELSEHGRRQDADPVETRRLFSTLLGEIENCDSIDLHYTGHSKEITLEDSQLLVLVTAMQEVDLSRLQMLNLSGCYLENPGKVIIMLADLVKVGDLPALQYLDLSGNYILKEDANSALSRMLKLGRLSNLQHLGLPRCNIDSMVDAILEGNVWQLKYLIFSGTTQSEKSRSSIHKLFESGHLKQLKKLVIKSRSIDSGSMVALAKALHHRPVSTLQTLDLSSNSLGVVGSIALARLIEDGNLILLQHLRLYSCSIDGDQMDAIAQGMESGLLGNLEHLDLSWNKFKDQGALALARVIETKHLSSLRRLNVGYCDIGTEFWLRHGILALLEALGTGHMIQLEWLNLLGNQIGRGAAITVANTIAEMLETMPALQFVNLIDGRAGNQALKEALDVVLRYPASGFTAVHSGLKRKSEIQLSTEFRGFKGFLTQVAV